MRLIPYQISHLTLIGLLLLPGTLFAARPGASPVPTTTALPIPTATPITNKTACEWLANGKPDQQYLALDHLIKAGAAAIPDLFSAVESEKGDAQRRLLVPIHLILEKKINQKTEFIPTIKHFLENADSDLIGVGLLTAAKYQGNLELRESLRRIITQPADEGLRRQALNSFFAQTNKDKSELPFLRNLFASDPSDLVRIPLAGILGLLGDETGKDYIDKKLKDAVDGQSNEVEQEDTLRAAGCIASTQFVPQLEKLKNSATSPALTIQSDEALKDVTLRNTRGERAKVQFVSEQFNEPKYSRWAASRLREMNTSRATEALESISRNPTIKGRYEAQKAIESIKRTKEQ